MPFRLIPEVASHDSKTNSSSAAFDMPELVVVSTGQSPTNKKSRWRLSFHAASQKLANERDVLS
jgi:hypothetical protein